MSKFLGIVISAISLGICSFANGEALPYDAWRLGFSSPDYMEVWIETADVIDMQGNVYRRAMSGIAATQTPPNNSGNPKGWPAKPGWGKGKYVKGADLPRKIAIRWQSLVEPQTYKMIIDVPDSTREIMLKGEKTFCAADGKWITGYREALVVGLAPGGIAKVWVTGPCLTPIEVTRVQAEVDPRGPYEGQSGGKYDSASDESKAYIKKFGVPYGSW